MYLNSLCNEYISVAPIAPPNISEAISCPVFIVSPKSLAACMFLPCSAIPTGIAVAKAPLVANFCALFNFSFADKPLPVTPASLPATVPGIKKDAKEPKPAPSFPEKASSYPSSTPRELSFSCSCKS